MALPPRQKSKSLEAAKSRLAGMQQIDKDKGRVIDYGDVDHPVTKTELQNQIATVEKDHIDHNQVIDQANALRHKIETGETALAEMTAAVLASAKAKFGRDSIEVEQLGGVRLSKRARPVRQTQPAAASTKA